MLDRSATTSLLPGADTMQPRTADEHSSLTLVNSRSSQSAFMASMPASITGSANVGRGRFCGWKMRPASRPVRDAPQNCIVPRRRSSDDVALSSTLYLAGDVAEACWRFSSNSRTSGARSPLSSAVTVPLVRSTGVKLCLSDRWSSSFWRWVRLPTAPSVRTAEAAARDREARSKARRADRASSRSIRTPPSLTLWSRCHSPRSLGVSFQWGSRSYTTRIASTSSRAYSMKACQSSGCVSRVARRNFMFFGRGLVNNCISFLPCLSLALSVGTPRTSHSVPSEPGSECWSARTIVSVIFSAGTCTPRWRSTVRSKWLLCQHVRSAVSISIWMLPRSRVPSVMSHTVTGSLSNAQANSSTSACSAYLCVPCVIGTVE